MIASSFFLFCVYMCVVGMLVCRNAHIGVHVDQVSSRLFLLCSRMQGPRWAQSSSILPIVAPCHVLENCLCLLSARIKGGYFTYVNSGDPNSGPHRRRVSSLSTESPSQSPKPVFLL